MVELLRERDHLRFPGAVLEDGLALGEGGGHHQDSPSR
jgi:hypothetical protein